jgi:methionyl-tRNA formyltransferase
MMRVLYFGMAGAFSLAPLDALLAAGAQVCGVVLPAQPRAPYAVRRAMPPQPAGLIPLAPSAAPGIAARGWERGIPVFELARAAAPEALAVLRERDPDVACVACWPRRIPPALLALPRHGFLNLHPSLLPAHRGPEPLFWTLRAGHQPGVTVHAMSAALDAGDIAAQKAVDLPDGVSGPVAERICATAGGELLADVLARLADGSARLLPQPPGGSYEPTPAPEDFALDTSWPARRAFNFMRGTADWGEPYQLSVGGRRLLLLEALSYAPDASLAGPVLLEGDIAHVQLAPGVLTARYTETASPPESGPGVSLPLATPDPPS